MTDNCHVIPGCAKGRNNIFPTRSVPEEIGGPLPSWPAVLLFALFAAIPKACGTTDVRLKAFHIWFKAFLPQLLTSLQVCGISIMWLKEDAHKANSSGIVYIIMLVLNTYGLLLKYPFIPNSRR